MADVERALREATPSPLWLDAPDRPAPRPPLDGPTSADLVVVGGGYSGLWTALLAKERDPGQEVLLIEGGRLAWAASGRNGGFCAASLTHGEANGAERWPAEIDRLEALGRENLDELVADVERHGIDADLRRTGELTVATEPYQVDDLRLAPDDERPHLAFLDREEIQAEVRSPTYLAARLDRTTAIVDPARLAWGLADACERVGVRIVEHTRAVGLARDGAGVVVRTDRGEVRARHVALGTNVFPSLVRRTRPYVVPVYDHVLATEPLTPEQLASIGWEGRQGIGDSANQFHYYRLTADDRILWGGYDAVYHFGGRVRDAHDHRDATYRTLARHFFTTFPQLEGVRFSHRWGGAIDTCSRFCAFFGTAHDGRVAYAAGYTGLGVGATRFGAQVMLDLLAGEPTERTELEMVRTKPIPFPPEPLAWIGITATRWSLDRADRNEGRRNLWLRALDRVGLGFDS
ncbi:MAG: FAD-dependent oxidoreductase [Acidimicrobiales bacterium]|nr:FAD-dependent oxidoreductase [Acidimicrobiales bacterium]